MPPLPTKTREVAEFLGIRLSTLHNLLKFGHVARPPKDSSGDLVWRSADIRRVKEGVAERAARVAPRPRGRNAGAVLGRLLDAGRSASHPAVRAWFENLIKSGEVSWEGER